MKAMSSVLLTTALLTAACGEISAPPNDEPKPAPSLTLTSVEGSSTFSMSEQKGKVVLADLWATWCAPCISELPHLQKLADTHDPEEFLMLGIILESGDPEDIIEFLEEKSVRYLNVLGEDGTKESFGPFLGYPTKYLIDKEGNVVKRYIGLVGERLYEDVEKLVRTGSLSTD